MSKNKIKFNTKLIHKGQKPEKIFGSISPPIYLTSTFKQEEFGEYIYDYSRAGNPTRSNLEENIASLEGGLGAVAFSSGMGAISSVIHLLSSGDEIIFTKGVYGGTYRLMETIYNKFSIKSHWVDTTDINQIKKVMNKKVRMIFLETPTNPLMDICDIKKISNICIDNDCLVVVDNTFVSPYFQRPLSLGADIVLHSTTKYLNGHSDVIGGIVIVKDEQLLEKLHFFQMSIGSVPSPFDCWLTQRSLKTLHIRMIAHDKNTRQVVKFLKQSDKIKKIFFPGLNSHPNHDIAKKQQIDPDGNPGYGGMLSIDMGSRNNARKFVKSLKIFILAESLGGVESLICHPASMTHLSIPRDIRDKIGVTEGLLRLSVGIEHIDDLLNDVANGLASI